MLYISPILYIKYVFHQIRLSVVSTLSKLLTEFKVLIYLDSVLSRNWRTKLFPINFNSLNYNTITTTTSSVVFKLLSDIVTKVSHREMTGNDE